MSEEREKALKSIFKGGMIVFIGFFIQKFSGLIYRVLVGRSLGPETYGIISVMVAVYAVASNVGAFGMTSGVQKFVASYRPENNIQKIRGVVKTGLLVVTPINLIFAATIFFGAEWIAHNIFHEPRAVMPLKMIAIALPFSVYTSILTNIGDAYEKMEYGIIVNKIWANISKIALAVPLVYLGYDLFGAAFAYAFSMASGVVLAFYFSVKLLGRNWFTAPAQYQFRELISFSWPLMLSGLFSVILGDLDTFMLQFFKGSESVGLYNAAYPFAALLTLGSTMFSSIFLSNASKMISNEETEELRGIYRTMTKWILIVTLPLFLIFIGFPKIILTIFGDQYYAAADVLRILSLGFILSGIVGPFGQLFQASNKTKLVFWQSVILAAVNILLNVALIPKLGITGAAIASSMSYFASTVYGIYFMKREFDLIPFRSSFYKIILSGLMALSLVYTLSNVLFTVTPIWFFAVNLAVFGFTYGVLLLLAGTIEEDDLMILKAVKQKTGVEIERIEKIILKYS